MLEQPHPVFFTGAEGPRLHDADGRVLIDYVMGQGPMLLGHNPPEVIGRVAAQLSSGVIYAGQHELELSVAEKLSRVIPGAESVRIGTTGTEAMLAALRVARATTGRRRIIKFRGHYHGWNDSLLFNLSRDSEWSSEQRSFVPVAETAGLPEIEPPIVLEWNDADQVASALALYGDQVAAIVMEPVMANVYVVPPAPGYLQEIRRLCDHYGVLLIFDEIITGFRLARGGAQERFGVRADLCVFGKALASGFPVSCVAGRRDLFDGVASGDVMLAGTFNSNPIGLAAADAVLDLLTPGLYRRLDDVGSALIEELRQAADSAGMPVLLQGYPQLFGLAATTASEVTSFAGTLHFDRVLLGRILSGLVVRGVRASGRGTFFLSAAHTLNEVEVTRHRFVDTLGACG